MSLLDNMKRRQLTPVPTPKSMPTPRSIDQEFQEIPRDEYQLDGSTKMERMGKLLTDGLTHAYRDGASALEAAIKESTDSVAEKQQRCRELDEQLDAFKRNAAEQILQFSQRAKELTAEVEASIEHLRQMTRWSEEQRATIKSPPRLSPPPSPPLVAEEIRGKTSKRSKTDEDQVEA